MASPPIPISAREEGSGTEVGCEDDDFERTTVSLPLVVPKSKTTLLSVLEAVIPVMSNVNVAVFKTLGPCPVMDELALL